jgi:hypothetical protein
MRWKTRGDGEAEEHGAAAGESGASSVRRSLRDGEGKERRGDPTSAVEVVVEEEAAAESELRVFTHDDGHMGGIGEGCRGRVGGDGNGKRQERGLAVVNCAERAAEEACDLGFMGLGGFVFCTNPAHYKQLLIHSNFESLQNFPAKLMAL